MPGGIIPGGILGGNIPGGSFGIPGGIIPGGIIPGGIIPGGILGRGIFGFMGCIIPGVGPPSPLIDPDNPGCIVGVINGIPRPEAFAIPGPTCEKTGACLFLCS